MITENANAAPSCPSKLMPTFTGNQAGLLCTNGGTIKAGDANTAIGKNALSPNSTGIHNTAIGSNVMSVNTTGYSNTGMGSDSLKLNTTGFFNISIGGSTLRKNTTGWGNNGVGHAVLAENVNGLNNTAMGDDALAANISGDENVSIGDDACINTTGDNNVGIGARSLDTLTSGSNNVGIGYSAGYYETGSNKLFIDNQQRASEVDARTKALIYGVFASTVAAQSLAINATVSPAKLVLPNSTTIPATCTVGELYLDTDSNDCVNTAAGDGALCICKSTNTWALVANI